MHLIQVTVCFGRTHDDGLESWTDEERERFGVCFQCVGSVGVDLSWFAVVCHRHHMDTSSRYH